ncbi:asparagine synthase (glutamine-hydrolyzing) [Pseudolysobacter antarcticus]|uniref:asparagine synthase (glutamine-hydrolyzing) n=1 Tax=Pseudolysobacter antarcticus TaxID=2511995 RepID=A0A411HJ80_9GAMM|nr:asparagine synthase (glutamine-hydrolyzing) [Pseudolysobacter antarcticus]QBB70582.1 asparagine synthase (glutamine-hydrolyzing) [Pseudolysobacter antarcticus]
MCGIAGFFGAGDVSVLGRMAARIAHRGPDDEGLLVDADRAVFLGFRRLAILDIEGGKQPMTTADGALTIVFNGEIYNFRELRKELEALGAQFRSDHSDTEVLLHGWRHWGKDLPSRLNGMWAFALYDRERNQVFFSRDRFGKKPLFFCALKNGFVFASELTALREHPAVPSTLSEIALRKYFAYGYVPAPLTFLHGVSKLPGGFSLTLDLADFSYRTEHYWQYQPEPFEDSSAAMDTRWIDEFRERLDLAVRRRLVADVPVGCFLSGGIDSSMVTALAMQHAGRDKIKAFSIGFEEASFDETRYARMVAEHVGADHQIETLSVQRALEILPDLCARLDEPVADSSILPTYLLCQHARRQVTVALGGDGADELLAGYDPFRALRYARWYEKLVPKPLHRAVSLAVTRLPVSHRYMSLDFRLKRTLRGLDHPANFRLPVWMAPLAPSELEQLFRAPIDLEEIYSEAIDAWEGCASDDPIERTIAFYIRLYLQDDILVKVDRASMLNSLEVRAPFLDIELVDFMRRLPARMKLRGGISKWILRESAKSLLPHEVLTRSKQGFAVPIGQWFSDGKLPDYPHSLNPGFSQTMLAQHRMHKADHRLYLWADWLLGASHLGAQLRSVT